MIVCDTLTMEETRTSLLGYDLQKVATSGMSSRGKEHRKHAQGLFSTRERTNKRVKARDGRIN